MASEITRDGITYKCMKTLEFTPDGEIIEHEGGELTESNIASMQECDKQAAEIEAREAQLEREDYECHHLTKEEKKILRSKKNKSLI